MSFSYYDNNNIQKSLDLKIGQRWDLQKIENNLLNTIFSKIDDGDQIVSETEFNMVQFILKKADSFFKKSNNILEADELNKLKQGFDSGEFNIENVFKNTTKNLNLDDFSIENLRKRYPEGEFDIETYEEDNGEKVIEVLKYREGEGGFLETMLEVTIKDGKIARIKDYKPEKLYINNTYENGELTKYRDAKGKDQDIEINNIAETLTELFNNDFKMGKLKKVFDELSNENITKVLKKYKELTGVDLETAILQSNEISKNKKEKLLSQLETKLYDAYDCNPNYKNDNSQIKNEYYTGAKYNIEQNGDLFIIKNEETGKTTELNLSKTVIISHLNTEEKIRFIKLLQTLPGEVLEDLAAENTAIDFENLTNAAGVYYSNHNEIELEEVDKDTFCHELGHAIDNMQGFQSKMNGDFKKAFDVGLKRFLADGNKAYYMEWNSEKGIWENHSGSRNNYATFNTKEMFAECYTLLMTGNCGSKDCILKYFPEALEATKAILEDTRTKDCQRSW